MACRYAENYDQNVSQGIFMEPAGIKNRSLLELAKDFGSTAAALNDYVAVTNCGAYVEARYLANKLGHGLVGYGLGLARLSNWAIAKSLTQENFWWSLDFALSDHDDMKASIVWGTESELSQHDVMTRETFAMARDYGAARVRAMMINGQKHAMGDDIYLHAAMVLQSAKQVS